MNFIRIFDNNFWGDEGFSIKLMKMTIPEMITATSNDVHPPLYYLFCMVLYKIFGTHGWVYHLSAIIPYLGIIIFSLTVLYKTFGKEAALLFITFSSILSNALTYDLEVRMYSLAAFFMVLSFYSLYRISILNHDSKITAMYLLFIVSSLCAAYTHYYCIISAAVFYIALLILFFEKRVRFKHLALTYIITIIGYLPWLKIVLNTTASVTKDFWMTTTPEISSSMLYFFNNNDTIYSLVMFCITVFLIFLLRTEGTGNSFLIIGALSAPLTSLFGIALSSAYRPVYMDRYSYPASVVFWLVLSICISKLGKKSVYTLIIIAITLLEGIPNYIDMYNEEVKNNQECAKCVAILKDSIKENDILITDNNFFDWTIFEYYLPDQNYIYTDSFYDKLEDGKNCYLAWSAYLTDDEIIWLNENGYESDLIIDDGLIGDSEFYFYRISKK
ncbi:MAG: glycosyltransferase family 39 protein [Lachnospiraceae bacterium]|nr:glycosyltransferase family 39 protein [Lachnospiraceae bacterium]